MLEENAAAEAGTEWVWEADPPSLTAEQSEMLDITIREVLASPLSAGVDPKGAKFEVWRYMEAAQWRLEPARGKRVSSFFLETLEWRKKERVDSVMDRADSFKREATTGKLFVRGTCYLGRPLIWAHLGRDGDDLDPEADVRFLIYTVERAIASMGPEALGPKSKGQFCVVIDCSMVKGMGQLPSFTFCREAMSMFMLRYPFRLGKLFLVNAGMAVFYLWQGISLLLPQDTRKKIEVVAGTDKQRQEVLVRHISAEALRGGRLGCPGAPPFDTESYLAGRDAGGVVNHVDPPPSGKAFFDTESYLAERDAGGVLSHVDPPSS